MSKFKSKPVVLVFFTVFLIACSRGPGVAGEYEADHQSGDEHPVVLKLHSGGKGSWVLDDESAQFRWEIRGKQIWLHTHAGGVIVGDITAERDIDIQIPGVGVFLFKKTRG